MFAGQSIVPFSVNPGAEDRFAGLSGSQSNIAGQIVISDTFNHMSKCLLISDKL